MRSFLILFTVVAVIYGKPQGYNYGAGLSGSSGLLGSSGLSGSIGSLGSSGLSGSNGLFGSTGLSGSTGHLSGGFLSAPSNTHTVSSFGGLGSSGIGGGFGSSGSIGFNGLTSGVGGGLSSGFVASASNRQQLNAGAATIHQEPLVHKQFITVSAPEDHENLETSKHLVIGRPQKNYRVVFIKAPSSSSANVKLSAEYAPQEEKTVIYVLSKKDNTLEINDIATPAPTIPAKPEVVFIKYKTEEEAQHAQQQIQAEYDRIQGTSEHTDGGIAPQHSVVGILDGNTGAHGGSGVNVISSGLGSGAYHGAASSISPQGISIVESGNHPAAAGSIATQVISSEGIGNLPAAGSISTHVISSEGIGNLPAAGSISTQVISSEGIGSHPAAGSISTQVLSSEGTGNHAGAGSILTHVISSEDASGSNTSATYLPPSDQH